MCRTVAGLPQKSGGKLSGYGVNGVFEPIPSAGKDPKYQMVLDSVQQAQEFRSKAVVWQFVPDGSRYKLYRVGMNGTGEYLVVGGYETFNPNIRHLNLSTSATDGTSFTITTVEEGAQKYLLLSCEKQDIIFSYTYYLALNEAGFYAKWERTERANIWRLACTRHSIPTSDT